MAREFRTDRLIGFVEIHHFDGQIVRREIRICQIIGGNRLDHADAKAQVNQHIARRKHCGLAPKRGQGAVAQAQKDPFAALGGLFQRGPEIGFTARAAQLER